MQVQVKQEKKRRTPGAAGRPRSVESQQAILHAALAILQTEGYRAVTMEGIAAKAGVGKQTIYRWWSSKAEVVLEATTTLAAVQVPAPDSGSLQRDVQLFLERTFNALAQTGSIVRSLMAEAQLDAEFGAALRTTFIAQRRRVLREILQRGVTRGELNNHEDLDLLLDLLYGPMWYRLLNQHAPLDKRFAMQLARVVCEAFAPSSGM